MNVRFWGDDEFDPGVDSDTVLMMQSDSILCRPFDVDFYRTYAMVGAVWDTYACDMLKRHWTKFLRPQQEGFLSGWKMDFVLNGEFPDVCQADGGGSGSGAGPVGNGGLSLRSRSAMRRAIETCPHKVWSGLDGMDSNIDSHSAGTTNSTFSKRNSSDSNSNSNSKRSSHRHRHRRNLPCIVDLDNDGEDAHAMQEDVYFATILRATNATLLPTAFVASLFAVEAIWPDRAVELYGGPPDDGESREYIAEKASCAYRGARVIIQRHQRQQMRSGGRKGNKNTNGNAEETTKRSRRRRMRDETVPIGFHKPYQYHDRDTLASRDVAGQCPLLRYMYDPLLVKS